MTILLYNIALRCPVTPGGVLKLLKCSSIKYKATKLFCVLDASHIDSAKAQGCIFVFKVVKGW